jgi:hypothetical protein
MDKLRNDANYKQLFWESYYIKFMGIISNASSGLEKQILSPTIWVRVFQVCIKIFVRDHANSPIEIGGTGILAHDYGIGFVSW